MEAYFLSIIMDIFFAMTIHVLYRTVLETRWTRQWKMMLGWLCYLAGWNLISTGLLQDQFLLGACSALLNLLAISILYKGSLRTKIMYLFLTLITGVISEAIVGLIFIIEMGGGILGQMTEYQTMMGSVMSKLIWFILIRIVLGIAGHVRQMEISRLAWMEIFMVPMLSLSIVCAMTFSGETESKDVLVITITALFFINIVTFYLYQKLQNQVIGQAEKRILQQQNDYYAAQYLDIERQWNHVRKLRHDMSNQYILERNYLQQHNYQELARLYEEKIGELTNTNAIINTGNVGIDSIVNYKVEYARDHQIEIRYETRLAGRVTIPNEVLNVVLGNLLDNAIEAVDHLEQNREISLKITADETALFIRVINSYAGERRQDENGNYLTSKMDERFHGIGLGAVRAIVQKYDGSMDIKDIRNCFKVEIILYMDKG